MHAGDEVLLVLDIGLEETVTRSFIAPGNA